MEIIKVCSYCNEVIDADAPAVQTTSVDVATLTGRNSSNTVVSTVRSYHMLSPDCYGRMLTSNHMAQAPTSARTDKSVDPETHEWSAAFGMTADEALSGKRRKYSNAHNPSVLAIQRKGKESKKAS